LNRAGTHMVEHRAIPALMNWHEEQVKSGLVLKDWEAATLDEFPFFPGRRRNGRGNRRSGYRIRFIYGRNSNHSFQRSRP
jgi:hypothetical protein